METCDCCGKKVDERSLDRVGQYFVCQACYHTYSNKEMIEKIKASE